VYLSHFHYLLNFIQLMMLLIGVAVSVSRFKLICIYIFFNDFDCIDKSIETHF